MFLAAHKGLAHVQKNMRKNCFPIDGRTWNVGQLWWKVVAFQGPPRLVGNVFFSSEARLGRPIARSETSG